MPYTPPAHSPSASPSSSRSSSFSQNEASSSSSLNFLNRSNPPRSTTYLHRQRRNSSSSAIPFVQQKPTETPPVAGCVRQSPHPISDASSVMPAGATFSPPESDEEDNDLRRMRDLGRLEHELKEIILSLPKGRSSSPDSSSPVVAAPGSPPPSRGRTIRCHNRAQSHPTILVEIATRPRSGSNSDTNSDLEDDFRIGRAPAMVRKKSGEVVKSSLKSPSRSRPCSVPSTPTFPKNVHFDARIEHVRHFLHSEKPSAISVGSSPVEGSYDDHHEYPFPVDDDPEYEIHLPNFPHDHEARKKLPVRLEKVCLSTDKKNLIGTVAVANLHFQKHVVSRFTFDYWQTTSEVAADWTSDVRRKDREDGIDRFVFKIKLAEQANLQNKTLFFCIRFTCLGQEFWDNNGGVNFQVDFKKVSPSQTTFRPQRLPRSRPSNSCSSRPLSMPNLDDFGLMDDAFFTRMKELGMGPPDMSKPKSAVSIDEETPLPARRINPSVNAFGNRYDFRTSLTAAIKGSSVPTKSSASKDTDKPKSAESSYFNLPIQSRKSAKSTIDGPPEMFNPDNFWITEDDKPSIESPSYRELLDNYCFFGSSKSSKPELKDKEFAPKKFNEQFQIMLPQGLGQTFAQPLTIPQHKATGNATPIPMNYAGYHHRRRGSGAFRFDAAQTPTAIC